LQWIPKGYPCSHGEETQNVCAKVERYNKLRAGQRKLGKKSTSGLGRSGTAVNLQTISLLLIC
jgi:hypothetical protein